MPGSDGTRNEPGIAGLAQVVRRAGQAALVRRQRLAVEMTERDEHVRVAFAAAPDAGDLGVLLRIAVVALQAELEIEAYEVGCA